MQKLLAFTTILFVVTQINLKAQFTFPHLEGWQKSSEIQTYNSETLWEYINGAATYYLKYGFEKLDIAEYSISSKEYISAEVYQHQSPLEAFGIYAFERPLESTFLKIGSEGYLEQTSLNYYAGNYYIKIIASQSSERSIEAIKKIANQIATTNNLQNSNLKILSLFPTEYRLAHSEKYYPENYLGHEFLHSATEVSFQKNEETPRVFIISCDTEKTSREIVKTYFSFAKMKKKPKAKVIYEINDMFNGLIHITYLDNKLYGISGCSDETFINNVLKQFIQ